MSEWSRVKSRPPIVTSRSTSAIADDLEADFQRRQLRSKKLRDIRKPFNRNKIELELVMLKSGLAYACADCGSKKNITVDHIHPIAMGGMHGIENLQFLCKSCNSRKGTKLIAKTYEEDEQITLF